jgi:hypothetical protein
MSARNFPKKIKPRGSQKVLAAIDEGASWLSYWNIHDLDPRFFFFPPLPKTRRRTIVRRTMNRQLTHRQLRAIQVAE